MEVDNAEQFAKQIETETLTPAPQLKRPSWLKRVDQFHSDVTIRWPQGGGTVRMAEPTVAGIWEARQKEADVKGRPELFEILFLKPYIVSGPEGLLPEKGQEATVEEWSKCLGRLHYRDFQRLIKAVSFIAKAASIDSDDEEASGN